MKPSRLPQITTILVMVFFYLPIGVLILNSFNASRFGTTWQGFSLKWYERLLERSDLWAALGNSLRIACIASIVSMILGTLAAFALHRYQSKIQVLHRTLVTIPLVLPALVSFNVDLIWFGIVTLLAVEIGLLTPPFGIAVFVIKATLGNSSPITLNDIFAGALPFAAIMLGVLLLVIAFPWLATALL